MRAEEERRRTGRESGSKSDFPRNWKLFVELSSHGCFRPAMDQTQARRTLQELIKREDVKNKSCIDCGNPNPQWASLRFSPFFLSRRFPKSVLSALPCLSACNAREFTEVSACTSGETLSFY